MILRSNNLVVERWPVDSLKPMEPTVRAHSKKQLRSAMRSWERYGQVIPIPVDEKGVILDLQLMWTASKALGETHVDVVVVRGKTPAELKAIRLVLNRLAQDASWNAQGLRQVFEELLSVNFDLDDTGFSPPEIDLRLNLDPPGAHIEENGSDIPPLETVAITTRGVIWQLGVHRIGCGDATDGAFVGRVLDGQLASIAFTDPPRTLPINGFVYGTDKHREFVQDTGELSAHDYFIFLCNFLEVIRRSCKPSALAFVCIDWRHITEMNVAARHCGMQIYNLAVWCKTNGGMGGIYRNAHELIPVYQVGSEAPPLNNAELGRHGRNRTNVWTYAGMKAFGGDRDVVLNSHPTAKPVALIADALRDVTKRRDMVIDTRLGSGTTLMAAHETGRICCGTELDPLYVDLIVRRWQNATGQDAVNAETGASFNATTQKLLVGPPESRDGE